MTKTSVRNFYNDPRLLENKISEWLKPWAYTVSGGGIVFVHHQTNVSYVKGKLRELGYSDIPVMFSR